MGGFDSFLKGIQNISKVKLHGGLVGKVSIVLIIFCLSLCGLAFWIKNLELTWGVIIIVALVVFTLLWRVIRFAEKNPQAALLEGAEFLVHERLVYGAKNDPDIPINPKEFLEHVNRQVAPSDKLPDTAPPEILPGGK
jgi:hypothetical protein